MNQREDNFGFTILEVLIVMGILSILVGLGLFIGNDFFKGYSLRLEKNTVVSALQKARSQSMNNIGQSNHGIYVTSDGFAIFQGPSYDGRSTSFDQAISSDPSITHSGLNEIVFSQLSGQSNASGTITLSNGISSTTISVNYEGAISW
jgi:prepilin-type N-terminal cleavage/methylation domain-containing protein